MKTLNKLVRQQIMIAVLGHAFAARFDAYLDEEADLRKQIYDRIYPAEIQQKMQDVIAFAAGMSERGFQPFDSYSFLTVNVGGPRYPVGYVREHIDPKSTRIYVETMLDRHCAVTKRERIKQQPVLCRNWSASCEILSIPEDDDLGKRIAAHWEEREKLSEDMTVKRAQIMGILAHCKNEDQLKAKWPEVMPIAEKFLVTEQPKKVALPAIITAELNAELGLPPSNDDGSIEVAA